MDVRIFHSRRKCHRHCAILCMLFPCYFLITSVTTLSKTLQLVELWRRRQLVHGSWYPNTPSDTVHCCAYPDLLDIPIIQTQLRIIHSISRLIHLAENVRVIHESRVEWVYPTEIHPKHGLNIVKQTQTAPCLPKYSAICSSLTDAGRFATHRYLVSRTMSFVARSLRSNKPTSLANSVEIQSSSRRQIPAGTTRSAVVDISREFVSIFTLNFADKTHFAFPTTRTLNAQSGGRYVGSMMTSRGA